MCSGGREALRPHGTDAGNMHKLISKKDLFQGHFHTA